MYKRIVSNVVHILLSSLLNDPIFIMYAIVTHVIWVLFADVLPSVHLEHVRTPLQHNPSAFISIFFCVMMAIEISSSIFISIYVGKVTRLVFLLSHIERMRLR